MQLCQVMLHIRKKLETAATKSNKTHGTNYGQAEIELNLMYCYNQAKKAIRDHAMYALSVPSPFRAVPASAETPRVPPLAVCRLSPRDTWAGKQRSTIRTPQPSERQWMEKRGTRCTMQLCHGGAPRHIPSSCPATACVPRCTLTRAVCNPRFAGTGRARLH